MKSTVNSTYVGNKKDVFKNKLKDNWLLRITATTMITYLGDYKIHRNKKYNHNIWRTEGENGRTLL